MEESLTSGGDSEYGTEPANDEGEPRHAAFRLEISRRVRMVAMMVWCEPAPTLARLPLPH